MKPRTSQQIDEELAKTLYIRLPYTIKSANQVKELFRGDIKIKMPRQSSRYCHIVFPSIEEKMKNLKSIKKLVIDGRHIIACPPKINPPGEKKKKEKKIRVPKPKPEPKVTKSLYISNIKPGTKAQEIKQAFPGCVSMVMLKSRNGSNRKAILKLQSVQLAGEYLRKEREWPEVRGNRLLIKSDTRNKKNKGKKKNSSSLKIYDGESEATTSENNLESSAQSLDSASSEYEDEDDEEEESNSEVEE